MPNMNIQATFVKGIRGTDDIVTGKKPHVAFVGRSNVGKSSLVNALTGRRELARSGKKPGKTTEINFFDINGTFLLADLPGYGYAEAAPKDREKLRKLIMWYLAEADANIQTVVLVIDVVAGITEFDEQILHVLREESLPYVVAVHKVDKLNQKDLHAAVKQISLDAKEGEVMLCSSKSGKGIDALRERLFA